MSDEWKSFMSVGQAFAAHDTVRHCDREYARGPVHANSVEGFNDRVRRIIAGVFHHISSHHADLYFNEIGFRWSQRVMTGTAVRRTRHGREVVKPLWRRIPPALQLSNVFKSAIGRQLRRTAQGASKSNAPSLPLVDNGGVLFCPLYGVTQPVDCFYDSCAS